MTEEEKRRSLDRLINETIDVLGEQEPSALPHAIRRKIQRQISGGEGLDDQIARILKERGLMGP